MEKSIIEMYEKKTGKYFIPVENDSTYQGGFVDGVVCERARIIGVIEKIKDENQLAANESLEDSNPVDYECCLYAVEILQDLIDTLKGE